MAAWLGAWFTKLVVPVSSFSIKDFFSGTTRSLKMDTEEIWEGKYDQL